MMELFEQGLEGKAVAAKLNVSPAAVSRRMSLLRKRNAPLPPELLELTDKQAAYVMAIANGATQVDAAMISYDCTSRESAKSLGHALSKMPAVEEAIVAVMNEAGLNKRYLAQKLKQAVDCNEPNVSLRGVELGFKVMDCMPANRNVNVNFNLDVHPVDLSKYQ